MEQTKLSPMQVAQPNWRKQTLNLFNSALWRYEEKLIEHKKPGNTQIEKELKKVHRLKKHIKNYWKKGEDDFDLVSLPMEAQDYGYLYDLLWKYNSARNQEFKEAEATTTVKAALESEKREIDHIRETLQAEVWQAVERGKILIDSLYKPKEVPAQSNTAPYSQQTIIGDVYGQVIGNNIGRATQNVYHESLVTLQELFNLVAKNDSLPEEIKRNAIGDIQTIQSQLMKSEPDKNILTKAKDALGVLANSIQVGQFATQALPLIQKLSEKLPL